MTNFFMIWVAALSIFGFLVLLRSAVKTFINPPGNDIEREPLAVWLFILLLRFALVFASIGPIFWWIDVMSEVMSK